MTALGAVAVRVCAHAKVNLRLRILDRRLDGYHEIDSVFHSIALHDRLYIHRACGAAIGQPARRPAVDPSANAPIQLEVQRTPRPMDVDRDEPTVGAHRDNLAWRAAELWMDRAGVACPLRIELEKAIPTEAGLGGGSADAAGVLLGMQALWRDEGRALSAEHLLDVAGRLGADVPFCLNGGAAHVLGLGERIEPLAPQEGWLVLLKPRFGVSTQWAYDEWDRVYGDASEVGAVTGIAPGPDGEVPFNELEPLVLQEYPALGRWRESLTRAGAAQVRMTGSGSALFGFARDEAHALTIAQRVVGSLRSGGGNLGGAAASGPVHVPGATLYRASEASLWVTRLANPGEERLQLTSLSPPS